MPQRLGEQPGRPQQESPEQEGSDLEAAMLKGTARSTGRSSLSCCAIDMQVHGYDATMPLQIDNKHRS